MLVVLLRHFLKFNHKLNLFFINTSIFGDIENKNHKNNNDQNLQSWQKEIQEEF